MLRENDGTPEGLRNLMLGQMLPLLERGGAQQLICVPGVAEINLGPPAAELERHQFTELCFCLRGRAEMRIAAQVAVCEENQLLVIPSGVDHSTGSLHCVVSAPEDVFSRLIWISIFPFGAVVNLCESAYGVHRSTARELFLSHHTQSYADQILAELRHPRPGGELMIKYAFLQLIVSLWRGQAAQSGAEELAARPDATPDVGTRLSDKVIHQLRRHYYLPGFSLESLARSINSNKSHVSRQFKRETGLTVVEYLHKVRVDAAKRLLLAGLKVSTVAEYVGFSDAYYFSRVFTRVAGCPPSEYRQRATD